MPLFQLIYNMYVCTCRSLNADTSSRRLNAHKIKLQCPFQRNANHYMLWNFMIAYPYAGFECYTYRRPYIEVQLSMSIFGEMLRFRIHLIVPKTFYCMGHKHTIIVITYLTMQVSAKMDTDNSNFEASLCTYNLLFSFMRPRIFSFNLYFMI